MITVQLPMFNEMYVVSRLLEAVSRLNYPKESLEIQVLDDSTDETQDIAKKKVKELKNKGFNIYYLHRKNRQGYKAGALEAGLKIAKGEFIALFDADFLPQPEILNKTIHYFTDPKVGMVQVRWGHINQDFSLFTQIQSMLLDGHFIIEHTARNRSGRFFNFNGTAGIWRRQAIEDAGGWQHDTLTEDMDLSYRAQLKGWKFIYLPEIVSPAELPIEMNAFKSQQFRWAKGSIQTAKKILPQVFKSNFPFKVKLEALFHLTNNIAYPLMVMLSLLLLPTLALRTQHGWREVLLIDLPLFFGTTISIGIFYLTSYHAIYGKVLRALKRLPLLMATGIGLSINQAKAVIEGLWSRESEFVRTPKHGIKKKGEKWTKMKYQGILSLVSIFEIAFIFYFIFTIVIALSGNHYLSVPFLLLFLGGYTYIGILSLYHAKKSRKKCSI
jgi:cellulose synthase/poly-beta-1,6-N-acetylglucosamine synthase-like glycosyltransferase